MCLLVLLLVNHSKTNTKTNSLNVNENKCWVSVGYATSNNARKSRFGNSKFRKSNPEFSALDITC